MLLLFFATLLLIVCNESVWSKVIRDAAKASGEPTAPPRIETAKKIVHLQANTLELRYAVTKDNNGKVVSLRVSAECSQFLDKMYLSIAFSAQGAMVPALALAGGTIGKKRLKFRISQLFFSLFLKVGCHAPTTATTRLWRSANRFGWQSKASKAFLASIVAIQPLIAAPCSAATAPWRCNLTLTSPPTTVCLPNPRPIVCHIDSDSVILFAHRKIETIAQRRRAVLRCRFKPTAFG